MYWLRIEQKKGGTKTPLSSGYTDIWSVPVIKRIWKLLRPLWFLLLHKAEVLLQLGLNDCPQGKVWGLSPENLNVSQGRRRQIKGQISSRPISRIIFSWVFHYIHTYVHCSLVAITTPEGRSWGYLSLQITHPAQERLATPPGSTFPTRFEQRCGIFYFPQEPDKWKCCETGPYPRRLASLTVCRCHYKSSTFCSVI